MQTSFSQGPPTTGDPQIRGDRGRRLLFV